MAAEADVFSHEDFKRQDVKRGINGRVTLPGLRTLCLVIMLYFYFQILYVLALVILRFTGLKAISLSVFVFFSLNHL